MNLGFKIKRFIKQQPFKRPQTHAVTMTCTVPKNTVHGYTIIPVPLNTSYQHFKNLSLSPTLGHELHTVGTNYCYVIANDLLKDSRNITLQYIVTVQPRQTKVRINPTVKKIYDYTISHLTYGNAIRGLYSYEESMQKLCVDCGGFSSVMQKLLSDEGITSRIVSGFWTVNNSNAMHAWLEYEHSADVWIPLDASTDFLGRQGRTYKTGGCGYVGSDRIVVSTGSHHNVHYKSLHTTLDILQTPITILPDNSVEYIEEYLFSTTRI